MPLLPMYRVLFWIWIGTEAWLQFTTYTRTSSGRQRDRGSLRLLVLSIALSVWFALQYGSAHPGTLPVPVCPRRGLAVVFVAVGLVVRWAAVRTLGQAFSTNVAIRSGQQLCQRGLYRRLRHPSYTGMMLCIISTGLITANLLSLLVVLVVPATALVYRIRVEEAALHEAFGTAYAAYCARTRRLIPFLY